MRLISWDFSLHYQNGDVFVGKGQFVSIKQISAKFLWHPAAVTNSSKRNQRGGQQSREGCFSLHAHQLMVSLYIPSLPFTFHPLTKHMS